MTATQPPRPHAAHDHFHLDVLDSGVPVQVRPLRPTDRPELAAAFTRLSVASRQNQFLTAMPQLSAAMLDNLLDNVDGDDHVALLLSVAPPGQAPIPIGIGQFVRNNHDHTRAALAVTIDDAWHGLGAGTILTRRLAAAARHNGIGSFTVTVECRIDLPATAPQLTDPLEDHRDLASSPAFLPAKRDR